MRTQSALAERIADLEGLDAAPKDVVSRVFRERPVEPQTLERVARALGVDAYTLYKTSSEESLQVGRAEGYETPAATRAWWPAAFAAGALMLLVGGTWWFAGDTPPAITKGADAPRPRLGLGTPTLTVLSIQGDRDGRLADALGTSFSEVFKVATNTSAVLTRELDPASAASRLRTDAVIDGEVVTVGRLSGIRLYLYSNGVRRQVWAESLPTTALEHARDETASRASLAVRRAMGMPVPMDALRHFPLAPVQDDYLRGELFLDRPSNELNVRRAQSYFESALRQDANFARAHAGLCRTFLEGHWMDNEETALRDAARACGQA
ncbi:MAG TPA: hypothetical protein VKZ91_00775, partial [Woeseiaceae bacterium]|nr:hypothetical protein [Woeseiaceae bacterium]